MRTRWSHPQWKMLAVTHHYPLYAVSHYNVRVCVCLCLCVKKQGMIYEACWIRALSTVLSFLTAFQGSDEVQWWTVSFNHCGTTQLQPLLPVIHLDLVCGSLHLSASLTFLQSFFFFCSFSHIHNCAVQMNAHTNVTDCETVTHTAAFGKRTLSHLFSLSKWKSDVLWSFTLSASLKERGRYSHCRQWTVV